MSWQKNYFNAFLADMNIYIATINSIINKNAEKTIYTSGKYNLKPGSCWLFHFVCVLMFVSGIGCLFVAKMFDKKKKKKKHGSSAISDTALTDVSWWRRFERWNGQNESRFIDLLNSSSKTQKLIRVYFSSAFKTNL